MINFLLGLIFGALPDSLYYFLMIKNTKEINKRKLIFFILILALYVVVYMILRYNFYLYLLFDIVLYFIIKLLYKDKVEITDFFLIIFIEFYFIFITIVSYFLLKDYYVIALIINKLGLFVPLLFKNKLKILYAKYKKLWNRNDKEKRKIKSLTLRNISLLILNVAIVSTYLILLYIVSTLK